MPHKSPEDRRAYKKNYNAKYKREYYAANKEKILAQQREYYAENKDSMRVRQSVNYRKNVGSYLLYAAKDRAKKLDIEFNLEKSDIVVPDVCPVFGTAFKIGDKSLAPSLDRIDPCKGYVKGNVAIISFRANRLKNNASADDLRKVAAYVERATAEGANPTPSPRNID